MLWGGRNTANKYHWSVWGVLAVSGPHWVCPNSQRVCFPGLHCSGSRLLSWELSKVGPGLHALPRSKPLRFRFWVLYKGTDLVGPVFCALPRSEQLRQQMLGQCTLPVWQCILSPPQSQPHGFLGVQREHHLKCAVCLLWGADLWL